MPSPLPYYPFYPRDFASSGTVKRMDRIGQAIYRELLDQQWEDGSLPSDPAVIQRMIKSTSKEWASFRPFLDKCFPIDECDGERRNPRMAGDREKALVKVAKRAAAGEKGGNAKQEKKLKQSGDKPLANAKDLSEQKPAKRRGKKVANKDTDTDTHNPANAGGDLAPDGKPLTPYQRAEQVLLRLAMAKAESAPMKADITPNLKSGQAGLQDLLTWLEDAGLTFDDAADRAVQLYLLAEKLWDGKLSWPAVFNHRQNLAKKLNDPGPLVQTGAGGLTDHVDRIRREIEARGITGG